MEGILGKIDADCGEFEVQKHKAATLVSTYLAKKYKDSFLLPPKVVL